MAREGVILHREKRGVREAARFDIFKDAAPWQRFIPERGDASDAGQYATRPVLRMMARHGFQGINHTGLPGNKP